MCNCRGISKYRGTSESRCRHTIGQLVAESPRTPDPSPSMYGAWLAVAMQASSEDSLARRPSSPGEDRRHHRCERVIRAPVPVGHRACARLSGIVQGLRREPRSLHVFRATLYRKKTTLWGRKRNQAPNAIAGQSSIGDQGYQNNRENVGIQNVFKIKVF